MPGITIREGSVIGAGSLVTKDTEPWMIYVGSPAKAVKLRDKELILRGGKELNNLN
jgi:galactoside O-acetyltransferase